MASRPWKLSSLHSSFRPRRTCGANRSKLSCSGWPGPSGPVENSRNGILDVLPRHVAPPPRGTRSQIVGRREPEGPAVEVQLGPQATGGGLGPAEAVPFAFEGQVLVVDRGGGQARQEPF